MRRIHPCKQLLVAAFLAVALLVPACGDDETPSGPLGPGAAPTIASFTATPSTLAASGDSVDLRWSTTGATSVAIEPGVGSVTPVDSGSVRRFVSATTTFTLTASNAAGSVSADAIVTVSQVTTITVTGRVVNTFGTPLPNTPVIISGLPPTTSDGNGDFTVTGVSTPYDATVVAVSTKRAIVYKALTRPDPTLYSVDLTLLSFPNTATVSGTITGGTGFPEPLDHRTLVAFGSDEASGGSSANSTSGAYSFTTGWGGPTTTTGTVHALQWQESAGLPVTYKGYGTKESVALADGGTFLAQNVTMSPIPTVSMSGNVTVPTGYTLSSKSVAVLLGLAGSITVLSDFTSSLSFTYQTPNIPGKLLQLQVRAASSLGTSLAWKVGLAPDASSVSIALPASPSQSLPVDGATNVDTTTTFSWTPLPGGVHMVYFNTGGTDPDYYVLTAGTSASIPNLNAIGLALPSSKAYTWNLLGFAPFATLDDAAGPGGFIPPQGVNQTADGAITTSSARNFTTKP